MIKDLLNVLFFGMTDFIFPASKQERGQLLLFHGYGSNAENLSPCGQYFARHCPEITVYVLNGHERFEGNPLGSGRQWFSLQAFHEPDLRSATGYALPLQEAIERAAQTVSVRCQTLIKPEVPLFIAGFSQGAALACHLGLFHLKSVCVLGFSGFYRIHQPVRYVPKFWLYHGVQDDVVPLEAMEHTRQDLLAYSLNVSTYLDATAEHNISLEGLEHAVTYLQDHMALK